MAKLDPNQLTREFVPGDTITVYSLIERGRKRAARERDKWDPVINLLSLSRQAGSEATRSNKGEEEETEKGDYRRTPLGARVGKAPWLSPRFKYRRPPVKRTIPHLLVQSVVANKLNLDT